MSTVQAPQWLVSQPICGPVIPSSSRSRWISNRRGWARSSTSRLLTVNLICILAIVQLPCSAGALFGAGDRALHHHPRDMDAEFDRSVSVGRWTGDPLGSLRGFSNRCLVDAGADQCFAGLLSEQRRVGEVGQRDCGSSAGAAGPGSAHRWRGCRIIPDLAFLFLIGPAVTARGDGDMDRGQDFPIEQCGPAPYGYAPGHYGPPPTPYAPQSRYAPPSAGTQLITN